MEFEIRHVEPEELAAVEPLIEAYQRFYEVEDIDPERNREFFSRFIGSDHQGWLMAAWQDSRVVGFACFYRHRSSLSATRTILMNDLYVAGDLRGGGIGRALIDAGLELVRDAGASCLEWSTAPDNDRAQALYDSTGAEKSTWITYELKP
jgi:ribosomal protein S18 acetylase RimI-like enzyme